MRKTWVFRDPFAKSWFIALPLRPCRAELEIWPPTLRVLRGPTWVRRIWFVHPVTKRAEDAWREQFLVQERWIGDDHP